MDLPASLLNLLPDEPTPEPTAATAETQTAQTTQQLPLLRIEKDRRKGNTATLITGYEEDSQEVRNLTKQLKHQLAVGGSTRDGEILLQGDVRQKAYDYLTQLGYKIKKINF